MTVTTVDAGPNQVSRSVEVNAPAAELFAFVADPRRHHQLDGSGTVGENIKAPPKLVAGARFSTKMKMFGVPYRITSVVTAIKPDELGEKVKDIVENQKEKIVLIKADERVDYSAVMAAMDQLRQAGIEDIGLITEKNQPGRGAGGGQ